MLPVWACENFVPVGSSPQVGIPAIGHGQKVKGASFFR